MTHLPLTPWRYGESMDAWFYPHVREKLAELIAKHDIRTVLEIGTCYGCSAIWFAQRVEHVTCVDTWPDIPEHGIIDPYEQFQDNIEVAKVFNVSEVEADSHELSTLIDLAAHYSFPDLVYLDGDHEYDGVKRDIELYRHLAQKVLCGDDYDVDLPSVAGVIRAVDECVPDRQTHGRFWWKEIEWQT